MKVNLINWCIQILWSYDHQLHVCKQTKSLQVSCFETIDELCYSLWLIFSHYFPKLVDPLNFSIESTDRQEQRSWKLTPWLADPPKGSQQTMKGKAGEVGVRGSSRQRCIFFHNVFISIIHFYTPAKRRSRVQIQPPKIYKKSLAGTSVLSKLKRLKFEPGVYIILQSSPAQVQ